MKAIILSAGQGKRLLPLTQSRPKCLLPLDPNNTHRCAGMDVTILSWQLCALEDAGVTQAIIVTGFNADKVNEQITHYEGAMNIKTIFNPFYKVADNLSSVWLAKDFMNDDFILLNGDTLFTASVAKRLIDKAPQDITLTLAIKDSYDDDDMKVELTDGLVKAVSKKLDLSVVTAESIGMMMFRGKSIDTFKDAVDNAIKQENGLKVFYLSVLNELAGQMPVGSVIAEQNEWCEVDFPADHETACKRIESWMSTDSSADGIRYAS